MNIILASGSPRRRELLEQAGYTFQIEVSDAEENIKKEDPGKLVEELSWRKASAVAQLHQHQSDHCIVIGADTVVVMDGKVLGKPADEADAEKMLSELSGRIHQVYTGVALLKISGGKIEESRNFNVCTDVMMREMTRKEIQDYVATGDPMDKAGAYGIQGRAAIFIEGIRGDYYNVVGLPLCRTVEELEQMLR